MEPIDVEHCFGCPVLAWANYGPPRCQLADMDITIDSDDPAPELCPLRKVARLLRLKEGA
jgi:hypothetical protein